MDKEKNEENIVISFLREFAKIFTLMILSMSLVGKLIIGLNPEIQNISAIFSLDGDGLRYTTILQFAGCAFILAVVTNILFFGNLAAKIPFLLRSLIHLLFTFFTTFIFSIIFKWLPVNYFIAWIGFLLSFFLFYFIAIGLSYLVLRFQDKKYNKFLADYRSRSKG